MVRLLLGIAEASFYPVAYASVIPRWYTAAERPKAIALMLTSLQVSAIVGSPLAGWILSLDLHGIKSWPFLFVIEAVPALIFGFVLLVWLKDWPKDARWLTPGEKQYLESAYRRETEAKERVRRFTVLQALGNAEVLKLCLTYFLWITGFWGYNYWMPTVLKEFSGWSTVKLGWMIVIPMGLSLLAMVFIGWSSSRTGEKRWHGAVPMFIAAGAMAAGTAAKGPVAGMIFLCFGGIGVFGGVRGVVVVSDDVFIGGGGGRGDRAD